MSRNSLSLVGRGPERRNWEFPDDDRRGPGGRRLDVPRRWVFCERRTMKISQVAGILNASVIEGEALLDLEVNCRRGEPT